MSVIRFKPKRRPTRHQQKSGDHLTTALAVAALLSVCTLGWIAADTFLPGGGQAVVASEMRVQFRMYGSGQRHTCVVDGDTVWLDGMNLRLQAYDTPEPYNDICGGAQEVALANRASARLLDLLNSNSFSVETFGTDRYDRTLATIRIGGTDVGDILISEGLARRWPDGNEFWC
ncbi:thermonuclease family protein [Devosia chinhatensis]|nr:thermonuclease family protein [Devosia chinhatensis]